MTHPSFPRDGVSGKPGGIQYWPDPALSGLLPCKPGKSRDRLPPTPTALLQQGQRRRSLTSTPTTGPPGTPNYRSSWRTFTGLKGLLLKDCSSRIATGTGKDGEYGKRCLSLGCPAGQAGEALA